ncbi:MAG: methionine--tRNA ligase [Thermodesulfobacteriaceae bacterium]|nr:methionine--tRNA ligase [Thermodesulfobacteriaceae bacterium]MCX8042332.1 methionine--tRNA ligase [Thermodesulfobacteriaceae bacterium]MDW8136710.1 methionine--tRNA ligase [Thermodesulfobacterium sp.]
MRIYFTTPIYYVNAYPHLGHAYTTIVVDVLTRFFKLKGWEVFFLTGTDEHGDKIQKTAKEKNKEPKELVDEISLAFKKTWEYFKISYNYFIRTTSASHQRVVQFLLQKLYDQGEFYLDEYEGYYCIGCERFLTSKELDEKGECLDHKVVPIYVKEKNYFFNLEKYRSWLKDYLFRNEVIYPEFYREEVLNLLEEELPPLCISRPKNRLSWGIELPFDKEYVTYVWFDALINYLTGIGYPENPEWESWWKKAHHFIAKDILKPHAIYWPIMLKAMGLPMYKKLLVHGYWLVDKLKMSKSLGNIIDPIEISEKYGRDQLRYFLLREMAFGYDAEFNFSNFILRINADLANDYGNLVYRTFSLIEKHFKTIPDRSGNLEVLDEEFIQNITQALKEYEELFLSFQFHKALERLWQAIRSANVYIDRCAPWELIKKGYQERAGIVLRLLTEGIKSFAIALYPVTPEASQILLKTLGLNIDQLHWDLVWNFSALSCSTVISKGKPLFPRVEIEKLTHSVAKSSSS